MNTFIRNLLVWAAAWLLFIAPVSLTARDGRVMLHPDDVVGIWLTQKQDSKVEIFKNADGSLSGRIVWAKSPNEKFEGIEVMRGVTYNTKDNTYACPWIYTPRLNMAARAVLSLEGDVLNIKVSKGVVTVRQVFTRVK